MFPNSFTETSNAYICYYRILLCKCSKSNEVFLVQKRIIRCEMEVSQHESCRNLFKKLEIMILELLVVVHQKQDQFTINFQIHNHNPRNRIDFHFKTKKLRIAQKSFCTRGLVLYNMLPSNIKNVDSMKLLKKSFRDVSIFCKSIYSEARIIYFFLHSYKQRQQRCMSC